MTGSINPQSIPKEDNNALTKNIAELHKRFFVRPFKDTRKWVNIVHVPSHLDSHLFGQLYADCFTHHNEVRHAPGDEKKFHFQNDPRRIVRKNNLTVYFQSRFDDASQDIYKTPSIFESPNSVEDESDLGPPTTFAHFYKCVTSIPFDPNASANATLGENRVTFLIGDVGIGKTFLVSRIAQNLMRNNIDEAGYQMIPVYVCLESFVASHGNTNDSPEFVRLFLIHIFDLIKKSVSQFANEKSSPITAPAFDKDATSESIASLTTTYLRDLAATATEPLRVVIFIDNLDVLHYQNSRYVFFPDEYTKHRRFIEDKLTKLVFAFVDQNLLGDSGLCCLIVARQNVARESRLLNQPALPRRVELNDHLVFQIGSVDPIEVVKSRLHMFENVVNEFGTGGKISSQSLSLADQLGVMKLVGGETISPDNFSDGLRRISDLSHHGVRSLVDFLGRLKLNLLRQGDTVQRLFKHAPWVLERLYISNIHQRYSQSQGHFPNVFLVDSRVSEDRVTDIYHRHTYWLKYLLLRRIGSASREGISVQNILDEFCGDFGYEDGIVRLCLGSLAMVNESRCLEIIGSAKDECHDNLIRLTSRGRLLVGEDPRYKFPYCFEFSYLQLVIDDHLLSIPIERSREIAVDSSLSYALDDGDKYYARMHSDLIKKLPATLVFLRVLKAAWSSECITRPKLAGVAASIGPDFEHIYSNLRGAIGAICRQANINLDVQLARIEALNLDASFDSFFADYVDQLNKCIVKYS